MNFGLSFVVSPLESSFLLISLPTPGLDSRFLCVDPCNAAREDVLTLHLEELLVFFVGHGLEGIACGNIEEILKVIQEHLLLDTVRLSTTSPVFLERLVFVVDSSKFPDASIHPLCRDPGPLPYGENLATCQVQAFHDGLLFHDVMEQVQ